MRNLLHLMSFRDKQIAGKSSTFTRLGRSGINQHENILCPSNCMLSLHCQWQSTSTQATDGGKPKVHIGPVLHLSTREEGARTKGGWLTSSLAAPNCPHAAWGSMATSGLQSSHPGSSVPWGEGDPHNRTAWMCPRARFILSTVDILLQFSRDWWEAQEVGGQHVCQYYDKVWWHIL